jgi:hypothetical protein
MLTVQCCVDPPASGMYSANAKPLHSHQHPYDSFKETEDNQVDNPVIFKTAMQNHDSPIDSPAPYPPPTQRSPNLDVERQTSFSGSSSSIVYETPIRDSQLQGLACYNDMFNNAEVDVPRDDVTNAHKRRKLTQACL